MVNVRACGLLPRVAAPCLALLCILVLPGAGQAQGGSSIPGLGSLDFPVTTTVPGAQRAFDRGALLLHLFHYADAREAFRQARRLDPGLAMAYWGEAMAWNYPVWNIVNVDSARAVLAKLGPDTAARRRAARSPREGEYLAAVELLYGQGSKLHRDSAYSRSMEALARAYPQDDEARLFLALSLMGLSQGVRDQANYGRAADLAEAVLKLRPQHPGAAHYLIHAVDDPDHARRGLGAARALAASAPDASHAQHMTSHIFLALGMWDDLVSANENAMRVVNSELAAAGRPPARCGHYNSWLEYGYLQQGRAADAARVLHACLEAAASAGDRTDPAAQDPDESLVFSAAAMAARYVIDTEDWSGAVSRWVPPSGHAPGPRLTWSFVQGLAAARRGDTSGARRALAEFERLQAIAVQEISRAAEPSPEDREYLLRLRVLHLELEGLLAPFGSAQSLALFRRAAITEDSMAYAFGPPMVDKPAHELLAEALLAGGRNADAAGEFRAALARTPRRVSAIQGLERADPRARLSE